MLIYNLVIFLYGCVIRIASVRKEKARQWVNGRKNWREIYTGKISLLGRENNIWIHCASYGEFEQGRPLIEAIKKKHPGYKIILTFFSPSGYEAFKDWKGADAIMYLPLDRKNNARDFIQIVKPEIAIFIKYEFWVNFLFELKKQNVPVYLVSAAFKSHHPFFKWYGAIFRRSLETFKILFLQDNHSAELLKKINIKNYEVCGDTRFDRVLEIKKNFKHIDKIKNFKGSHKLIIAGSTWTKDDELVLNAFINLRDQNIKLLIVPHEVDDRSINETVSKIKERDLSFSLYTEAAANNSSVMVLNAMGLLSKTYFYADMAYIGGGFNGGLHNTLEAAVYGVPLAFYGKEYLNYNETVELVSIGAAFSVNDAAELNEKFRTCLDNDFNKTELSVKLNSYFESNSNITDKVLSAIRL